MNPDMSRNDVDTSNRDTVPDFTKLTTKEAYFEVLKVWVAQAKQQHAAAANFPYYLMANPQLLQHPQYQIGGIQYPNLTQQSHPLPDGRQPADEAAINRLIFNYMNRNNRQNQFLNNQQRNEEIINQNGGFEYVLAPLYKRFFAEVIDVVILFILKLIVAFMIIDIFEIDFGFDFDAIKSSIEDDYSEFIQFSSEMVYIEIITKIVVCFYEALWTRQSHGQIIGGATPGKIVMGIRILYVEAVVPLDPVPPVDINLNQLNHTPLRALVFPGANLGFKKALARALAKNLLMALLFPFCFAMFFFRSNRTSYDIMTKTIVVEENPAPVLRRR